MAMLIYRLVDEEVIVCPVDTPVPASMPVCKCDSGGAWDQLVVSPYFCLWGCSECGRKVQVDHEAVCLAGLVEV